jgi:hypothetical protein
VAKVIERVDNKSAGSVCDHRYPMLVTETNTGCYARCLACLATGPERPTGRAARQALAVLGARPAGGSRRAEEE